LRVDGREEEEEVTTVKQHDGVYYETLRDDYLFCRTVGHAWEEVVAIDLPKPEFGWRFSVRCMRCTTHRHMIIDPRLGDAVSKRYDYPEGYKLDEKATRSEIRMEWGRRRDYDFIGANRQKRKKAS
jgi:hypothetical protein